MDKHLFLIGMQGCGKSSLGKRTAKETGVPFADTDAIVRHAREIGAYFHRPLSELQVPLLLTGSEEDEMFPPGHYQRLFHEICQKTSRAEAHIFPHGGHPAMMSSMEAFAALLDRFIESND